MAGLAGSDRETDAVNAFEVCPVTEMPSAAGFVPWLVTAVHAPVPVSGPELGLALLLLLFVVTVSSVVVLLPY